MVQSHNAEAEGYKIGINAFADLSLEEFAKMQGFKEAPKSEDEKFLSELFGDDEDEQTSTVTQQEEK